MPSVITHSIVGIAIGKACTDRKMPRLFWDLTIVCALLPDLDVICFAFGIPYGHFIGHRGFTHSLFFALLVSMAVVLIFYRREGRWWFYLIYFFIVTAMNGVLDAFTNGGHGVALLAPFDNTRFFFPWRPIVVSPIGIRGIISLWGLRALASEILWVWLPAITIVIFSKVVRKLLKKKI